MQVPAAESQQLDSAAAQQLCPCCSKGISRRHLSGQCSGCHSLGAVKPCRFNTAPVDPVDRCGRFYCASCFKGLQPLPTAYKPHSQPPCSPVASSRKESRTFHTPKKLPASCPRSSAQLSAAPRSSVQPTSAQTSRACAACVAFHQASTVRRWSTCVLNVTRGLPNFNGARLGRSVAIGFVRNLGGVLSHGTTIPANQI